MTLSARVIAMLLVVILPLSSEIVGTAHAQPTLKGPMDGILVFDPADPGFATFTGGGHLTLMGKVAMVAEMRFVPGAAPGTLHGTGVAAIIAANGDVLTAKILWLVDAQGMGKLEFRWPGVIMFRDGTVVASTGRFVTLPFAGLRGTSASTGTGGKTRIVMTGEIVDPDPLD